MAKKPNALMAKLLKNNKKDVEASILTDSRLLDKSPAATTPVPLYNVACSGTTTGGVMGGVKMIVGDSRTFKTNFLLLEIASYLNKYPEAVCIFCDSEFGANVKYWQAFGIDTDRVIHIPITSVEEMRNKVMANLLDKEGNRIFEKGDKVFIAIDSVSQLPSLKEMNDAVAGEQKADLTRAKALNSFWRMVTPQVNLLDIPLVWINSFYDDIINQYAEINIKGGKQGVLSSDTIFHITRAQDKDGRDLLGWYFNVGVMKGRFVQEKSKFPIHVTYDHGIDRYSGLLEVARALGWVEMVSNGWYSRSETKDSQFKGDKKWRKSELMCEEFWGPLLENVDFSDAIRDLYALGQGTMIADFESIIAEEADNLKEE